MAYFFGTSYFHDAFNIAFNIPNLLRKLFGEGALSAAFVPIYNEFAIKKGKHFQILFALNLLSVLSFFLMILTFLGMIFSPLLVKLLYPGLAEETALIAIKLCRIMYPYLFFIGLSSTFIAILNSHNIFFITGLSSGLLNIGWVITLILGYYVLKKEAGELVYFAAWGVLVGGLLQTICNLPSLKKIGYRFLVILRFQTVALKILWQRFIPGLLGIGVREINLVADSIIASFLPTGSITALALGSRLMHIPLGIFGISLGTAVLPEFSRQFTEKRWSDLSETLKFSLNFILFILAPITILMIIGSDVFIRLLFQRGEFDENAVNMTKLALSSYSLGLCFYGLNQVITPVFFAAKDTKTPVLIAGLMVGLNIALSVILMQLLAHAGIALATSVCAMTQFTIKFLIIKKRFPEIKLDFMNLNIIKLLIILLVLCLVLSSVNYLLPQGLVFQEHLKGAMVLIVIFGSLLFLLFHLFKPDYYQAIEKKLLQKIKRK